jgi:hypothetical protein
MKLQTRLKARRTHIDAHLLGPVSRRRRLEGVATEHVLIVIAVGVVGVGGFTAVGGGMSDAIGNNQSGGVPTAAISVQAAEDEGAPPTGTTTTTTTTTVPATAVPAPTIPPNGQAGTDSADGSGEGAMERKDREHDRRTGGGSSGTSDCHGWECAYEASGAPVAAPGTAPTLDPAAQAARDAWFAKLELDALGTTRANCPPKFSEPGCAKAHNAKLQAATEDWIASLFTHYQWNDPKSASDMIRFFAALEGNEYQTRIAALEKDKATALALCPASSNMTACVSKYTTQYDGEIAALQTEWWNNAVDADQRAKLEVLKVTDPKTASRFYAGIAAQLQSKADAEEARLREQIANAKEPETARNARQRLGALLASTRDEIENAFTMALHLAGKLTHGEVPSRAEVSRVAGSVATAASIPAKAAYAAIAPAPAPPPPPAPPPIPAFDAPVAAWETAVTTAPVLAEFAVGPAPTDTMVTEVLTDTLEPVTATVPGAAPEAVPVAPPGAVDPAAVDPVTGEPLPVPGQEASHLPTEDVTDEVLGAAEGATPAPPSGSHGGGGGGTATDSPIGKKPHHSK